MARARAQVQGRLHRNFQGYSTRPDCDLLGLGVSAISKFGPTYSQNVRELDEYCDRLDNGMLRTARGVLLDMDDLVRRAEPTAMLAAYHLGRLFSYATAGLLAGAMGGRLFATQVVPLQLLLLCLASVMLLAIGATLLGKSGILKRIEPIGQGVWAVMGPLARRVFPPRSPGGALLAGLAWGWIPCGMVYGALPLALASGGPVQGVAVMLAFGMGTLPSLLTLHWVVKGAGGLLTARIKTHARAALVWVRPIAGTVIMLFGVSGLAHAAQLAGAEHPAVSALASLCH